MVHLEVGHRAARLAPPAVAMQHLGTETVVLVGIEPHRRDFRSDPTHDTFSLTWCRNVSLSSAERNLKNRNAPIKRSATNRAAVPAANRIPTKGMKTVTHLLDEYADLNGGSFRAIVQSAWARLREAAGTKEFKCLCWSRGR